MSTAKPVARTSDALDDIEVAALYAYCAPEPSMYDLLRRLVIHGQIPDPPTPHETCEPRNQDERTLRRLLAFAYSGSALYGDDGELQDGRHPIIDYVRDSVADIERKIRERGMAMLAAAACPECRYVIGHKAGCSSAAEAETTAVHYDPTGKTREPPHCPTCDCGSQKADCAPDSRAALNPIDVEQP